MNNFFINVKLFIVLQKVKIDVYRTVERISGFLIMLVKIWKLFIKKNNWDLKVYIIVFKNIFCLV